MQRLGIELVCSHYCAAIETYRGHSGCDDSQRTQGARIRKWHVRALARARAHTHTHTHTHTCVRARTHTHTHTHTHAHTHTRARTHTRTTHSPAAKHKQIYKRTLIHKQARAESKHSNKRPKKTPPKIQNHQSGSSTKKKWALAV